MTDNSSLLIQLFSEWDLTNVVCRSTTFYTKFVLKFRETSYWIVWYTASQYEWVNSFFSCSHDFSKKKREENSEWNLDNRHNQMFQGSETTVNDDSPQILVNYFFKKILMYGSRHKCCFFSLIIFTHGNFLMKFLFYF